LKSLRALRIAYELALCDPHLAKILEKYYTMHIKLMRDWGEFNPKLVKFSDNPPLFSHLPDSLLQDLIEAFTELIKLSPKGAHMLQKETVINLTEFCITILRTNTKAISNPYTKAKALELIAIFIYADSKKELMMDFN
jgi:hypothetical protein